MASAKQLEKEWNEKYGKMSEEELNNYTQNSIAEKLDAMWAGKREAKAEEEARFNLPYGELVKKIKKLAPHIKELEEKLLSLRDRKKEALNKEFDAEIEKGSFMPSGRELWVSERLLQYFGSDEYTEVKNELSQARNDYAKFVSKKEERKAELAPIIEAERYRTMRAELLQADPEELRELGIDPAVSGIHTGGKESVPDDESEYEKAVKGVAVDPDGIFAYMMATRGSSKD